MAADADAGEGGSAPGKKRLRAGAGAGDGGEDGWTKYARASDNAWRRVGHAVGGGAAGRAHVDVRDTGNSLYSYCAEGDGGAAERGAPGPGARLLVDEDGDAADEFIKCDATPPRARDCAARACGGPEAAGNGFGTGTGTGPDAQLRGGRSLLEWSARIRSGAAAQQQAKLDALTRQVSELNAAMLGLETTRRAEVHELTQLLEQRTAELRGLETAFRADYAAVEAHRAEVGALHTRIRVLEARVVAKDEELKRTRTEAAERLGEVTALRARVAALEVLLEREAGARTGAATVLAEHAGTLAKGAPSGGADARRVSA